jgi:hypothetical protein
MTQGDATELDKESDPNAPLNMRQLAFARELGVARAAGGRDDDLVKAYAAAGYKPDRGNARRLAADPRIKAIADEACKEALELAGLHIQYLQAKALELLHASPTKIFRAVQLYQAAMRERVAPEAMAAIEAELDAITWPLNEFKIDKDGVVAIKLPDRKGIIEMLAKQLGVGKDDSSVNVGVTLEALVGASMTVKENAA